MVENIFTLYQKSQRPHFLIRAVLLIVELYDQLDRYADSANFLLRIANEIKEQSVIVPLFYE